MAMTEQARQKRNAYIRDWRAKNKDKVKAYNEAYWLHKTEQESKNEKMES